MEISKIIAAADLYKIRHIHFVGGETTFYIAEIRKILDGIADRNKLRVRITTNGHFATTQKLAIETLSSIPKLKYVQLSYDKFHAKFLSVANVRNLYAACKKLELNFGVLAALQSATDITVAKQLSKIGDFTITMLPVLPAGAAKKNNVSFSYPSFNGKVLLKRCPSRNVIVYLCGQGFTNCCSSLAFNSNHKGLIFQSIEELLASSFHELISRHSMGALLKNAGIDRMD